MVLDLNNNKFEGSIDLTKLPEGGSSLYLQSNSLNGELNLSRIPPDCTLNISWINFRGEIRVSALPRHGYLSLIGNDDLIVHG